MTSRIVSRFASLGLLALIASGCASKITSAFRENLPPEVRLTQAPVNSTEQYFYSYRMNWIGYDPDGRVDHFLISVDPRDPGVVDTTTSNGQPIWQETAKNEEVVSFRATRPDTIGKLLATDYHTFAVVAVDEKGAFSSPVWRTFNSYTIAPQVVIDQPRPSRFITPTVTPSVRMHWTGLDPDGQFTIKPTKYKFKLFRPRDPDFPGVTDPVQAILSEPRLLRWKYAPLFGPSASCPNCSYWDSTPADTTGVQYTNLVPNNNYLFAVTAFDEAGAYDPIFSQASNLLEFQVTYAGTNGPKICIFNQFFNFCYEGGGYASDPTRYVTIEVPADQTVTFNWFAIPPTGADIRRYRWVLDLQDLTDETKRTDDNTDWSHWSSYGLNNTSATIGPYSRRQDNGTIHLFFIEAEDNNGLRSLGIVQFTVVRATFENDLLFVNDTRLTPDGRNRTTGQLLPPNGAWPTAAELDTFFFAKGGKPWIGYPVNSLSPEGIFNGFTYDTMGTRFSPTGTVSLARLGRYRTVVWYTDGLSAEFTNSPGASGDPITALRFMSSPGSASTISTYIKQGGRVWLFGGGAAYATLKPWDRPNTPPDEFNNTPDRELVSGRLMYDFAHWQSALMVRPSTYALLNTPEFGPPWQNGAPGRGWTEHGLNRNLTMPDYNKLITGVPMLAPRTEETDPPSPLRFPNSSYLIQDYFAEYMGTRQAAGTNFIREDADPSSDTFREESTLDTLYFEIGGSSPPGRPIMTYYHGFETSQMVFSGFPLWHFQRAQVRGLADFVLRDIFDLQRQPTVPPAPARSGPVATAPASPRHLAAPQRR